VQKQGCCASLIAGLRLHIGAPTTLNITTQVTDLVA
jgi:hypothetical protein